MSNIYLTDPKNGFNQYHEAIKSIYQHSSLSGVSKNHELLLGTKSLAVYDFEVQQNIYSCSVYFKDLNRIIIFYYTDDDNLIDEAAIIAKTHKINDYTLSHYNNVFKKLPDIQLYKFRINAFRKIFENPQDYVIGFNSNNYDLVIASFILKYIYTCRKMPSPGLVRLVSNLLISPKSALNGGFNYDPLTRRWFDLYVNKNPRITVRNLEEMFSSNKKKPNDFYLGRTFNLNLKSLSSLYYNLKSSGYHVDMRGLNEKDKDSGSGGRTASLKRISAQLGYQIEEPEDVDLSSNAPLNSEQITNLLAYNVSDVLVTTLIFYTKSYQNVLSTREQLINRFGAQFKGKRNVNSTSANFVESVIAPNTKLADEDEINMYYPVHGKKFEKMQAQINKDYAKTLTFAEIKALDEDWTNRLRKKPGFEAKVNRFDNKLHERYRVHFGEIEEDLLELLASFSKFPEKVYKMYSYFRGAKSEYATVNGQTQLIKTARDVAVENFVKDYPTPEEGFIYNKKQGTKKVTGVRCDVTIENQPMVLSFSVGGIHGEVIDDKSYKRDRYLINTYNHILKEAKTYFNNDAFKASDYTDAFYKKFFKDPQTWADRHNPTSQLITNHGDKLYARFKRPVKQVTAKSYVIPIDMSRPVHVDVDSLYPSLMINLHMFAYYQNQYVDTSVESQEIDYEERFGHWHDTYAKLREERVRLKKFASSVAKENWDEQHRNAWAIQLLNKLILNSASGIADGKWNTNIRMNNRAASMRIIGQLILTYLILRVEPKGIYSVSTNTDGVYLTSDDPNFTESDIEAEIEEWKEHFHLGATPEIMSRFISKDANNRFEQEHDTDPGNAAGGIIANFEGANSSSKMKQPFIIDEVIVAYFKAHKDITTSAVDDEWLRHYMQNKLDLIINADNDNAKVNKTMLAFSWTAQPAKGESFVLESSKQVIPMSHVNRLLLVKSGYNISCYKTTGSKSSKVDDKLTKALGKLGIFEGTERAYRYKITNFDKSWHVVRVNLDLSKYLMRKDIWENIDLDAYVNFAKERITGKDKGTGIWVRQEFKLSPRLAKFNSWLKKPYKKLS